jgi:ketosteroid isomerase-like protein
MSKACILTLLLGACVFAQPDHPAVAAVMSFVEATRTGDVKTLESLTAPQFFEVSPAGQMDPREKFLGFYAPSKFDASRAPKSIGVDEITVVDLGQTAMLCWKETFTVETPAGARSISMRSSGAFQKTPTGWKIVSRQVTGIRSPSAPPKQP